MPPVAETPGTIPTTRKPRWYVPTPAKFLFAVLVMQGVLFLSAHYRWFWFNERKGYTVLITVAATAVALLLFLGCVVVSRFFKSKSQFSLTTLLLMVPVMAIPCGWLVREIERARWQRDAIASIERRGGRCEGLGIVRSLSLAPDVNRPAPAFLVSQLGNEFFYDVFELSLFRADSTDLRTLKHFPELRCLLIPGANISDPDLAQLKELAQLRVLGLERASIGDSGLEYLVSMKQLVALFLDNTLITDAGLEHLKGLTELRALSLPAPPVTEQGISSLRRALPNCNVFYTLQEPEKENEAQWKATRQKWLRGAYKSLVTPTEKQ
jgi:hypothetical protein